MTDPTRSLTDDIAAAIDDSVFYDSRSLAEAAARVVSHRAEALAAQWDEQVLGIHKRAEQCVEVTTAYRLRERARTLAACAAVLRSEFTDKETNGER